MPDTNAMAPARGFRLMRFGPIELRIDPTWFIWFVLITLVAKQVTPDFELHSTLVRWSVWAGLALGISACVVVHELAHSIVAIAHGLPGRRITLFMFGGVSHIEREAPRPSVEYQVAIAGPLTSLVLATVFGGVSLLVDPYDQGLAGAWGFVSYVNVWLFVFNLLPAFPMDGGRVLRSVIWRFRSRARATRLAGVTSRVFAMIFILGGVAMLGSALIGGSDLTEGIWLAGIGAFLYNAASAAERLEGGDIPNDPELR